MGEPYATGFPDLDEEIFKLRAELAQVKKELEQEQQTLEAEASTLGTLLEGAQNMLKTERARAEKAEQFREAVMDALVVSHIYVPEHDTNPRKAINDLICWEQQIALDPLVSNDARALIERAVAGCAEDCAIQVAAREKAEQENARLREALAAETERCAQVALSYWEYHKKAYLHHIGHWQAAADYHLQLQAAGSQIADRIRARTALGGE